MVPSDVLKGGVMIKQISDKKMIVGVIIENKIYCIDCCNPDKAQYIVFDEDIDKQVLRCNRCERKLYKKC